MSTAGLAPEIITVTVDDDDRLKDVDFDSEDLAVGEDLSAFSVVAKYKCDKDWRNPEVTTDIDCESNGQSGTVGELLFTDLSVAGRYRIDVKGTTDLGQVINAQVRIHVEDA